MFNRETNKSRGFGFVIFETEDSVDGVLEEQNHVIDGKSVSFSWTSIHTPNVNLMSVHIPLG
jgi:RNA recognition motif-containing protein